MRLLAWCNTSDFDPSIVGFILCLVQLQSLKFECRLRITFNQ
jgi:hypothetical protein